MKEDGESERVQHPVSSFEGFPGTGQTTSNRQTVRLLGDPTPVAPDHGEAIRPARRLLLTKGTRWQPRE